MLTTLPFYLPSFSSKTIKLPFCLLLSSFPLSPLLFFPSSDVHLAYSLEQSSLVHDPPDLGNDLGAALLVYRIADLCFRERGEARAPETRENHHLVSFPAPLSCLHGALWCLY